VRRSSCDLIEGHAQMMARLGDGRGGTEVKPIAAGSVSWFPSATAALRYASSL